MPIKTSASLISLTPIDADFYRELNRPAGLASIYIPLPQGRPCPASSMSSNFAKLLLVHIKSLADLWRSWITRVDVISHDNRNNPSQPLDYHIGTRKSLLDGPLGRWWNLNWLKESLRVHVPKLRHVRPSF